MAEEPKVDSPSAGLNVGPPSGVHRYEWGMMRQHFPACLIELALLSCFNKEEISKLRAKIWNPLPADDARSFMKVFCKRYGAEHGPDKLASVLEAVSAPEELRFPA